MWHAWIGVDFVLGLVLLEVFPALLEDLVGEKLVVFWLVAINGCR
jgi:hypothetical protein